MTLLTRHFITHCLRQVDFNFEVCRLLLAIHRPSPISLAPDLALIYAFVIILTSISKMLSPSTQGNSANPTSVGWVDRMSDMTVRHKSQIS